MLNVDEMFEYHSIRTEERRVRHEKVDQAAKDFALVVDSCLQERELKTFALMSIYQARMFANQAITLAEVEAWKTNDQTKT